MDKEMLNRAIEIIQADPSSYGINPQPRDNRVTTSGGTIQIDGGPVETYGEYNNRIEKERQQSIWSREQAYMNSKGRTNQLEYENSIKGPEFQYFNNNGGLIKDPEQLKHIEWSQNNGLLGTP